MRIVLNSFRQGLIEDFKTFSTERGVELIVCESERELLDEIDGSEHVTGFILSNHFDYVQKVVDSIRKKRPNTPIIVFASAVRTINGADIQMGEVSIYSSSGDMSSHEFLFDLTLSNIDSFNKTFKKLQRLTVKEEKPVEFGPCTYDPMRRLLSYDGEVVKKLTAKEGGILEMLAVNFGNVVKKDIILEKVWGKTDHFAGRSMDVYVTNLRNLIKNHNIEINIQNISGLGLILDNGRAKKNKPTKG